MHANISHIKRMKLLVQWQERCVQPRHPVIVWIPCWQVPCTADRAKRPAWHLQVSRTTLPTRHNYCYSALKIMAASTRSMAPEAWKHGRLSLFGSDTRQFLSSSVPNEPLLCNAPAPEKPGSRYPLRSFYHASTPPGYPLVLTWSLGLQL